MKTFLRTATAVIALVLSIPSAQAQYQGSDEARECAQSSAPASGGYGNGSYAGRYHARYYRCY